MNVWNTAEVLPKPEVQALHDQVLRLLSEIGVYCAHDTLLDLLVDHGAVIDREKQIVRFPVPWVEQFLAEASDDYDDDDALETSCTLPWGRRREYSGGMEATAGCYPQYVLTDDGQFVPHTRQTIADFTRLADALPNLDRLGVMGVPADVPARLGPLHMRLLAWKHAERKLSGCGEVRDPRLIPYILEMGRIFAGYKGEPESRYGFAEVELLSPLRFGSVEAEIFVQFWQAGLRAGIGFMPIAGASTPVTLAACLSVSLAEALFVSILYRLCYGLRKLYIQANSSALDMRAGWFPFGRPERALLILASGQMARFYRAGLWASVIHNDSRAEDIEAGYAASFNAIPGIMAGTIGLESYGLVSGGDASSAVQLVLDDEYVGGLKRFTAGFEVIEDTLDWADLAERGIGGSFLDTDHTARHFRREQWQPEIFSRDTLNGWLAGDRKHARDLAHDKAATILAEHHPVGMDEATEAALREVIARAERELQS